MFKLSKRSAIIFKMTVCLSQRNTCLGTENSSRHEIKGKNRIFRVASLATKFLRRFPYYKFSKNRYIRFSHRPSTQTIYSLISRSLESGEGCIIKDWNMGLPYAFLSFSMISRVFLKTGMGSSLDFDCTGFWYAIMLPRALKPPCVKKPVLMPQDKKILISPKIIFHPLMGENSLALVAWFVSGKPFLAKEFQKTHPTLSQTPNKRYAPLL